MIGFEKNETKEERWREVDKKKGQVARLPGTPISWERGEESGFGDIDSVEDKIIRNKDKKK